jgi:chromosome segregation ATPase
MKNRQANLLITLALALCGLCAWQWHEQTVQRDEIGELNGIVYQKNSEIQNDTNSIALLNHQLEQLDTRLTEIKSAALANEQSVASQKRLISQLEFNHLNLTNQVTQYQQAVATLQTKLQAAYAELAQQNDTLTNLLAQRDDFVKKFNDSVKDRNDVVAKYNELVSQLQKPPSSSK